MRLSDSFLEQLRANTDIESVISPYVNLRRRGKNLVGLCPFHNEKTPSFTVYPENGSFYCFGCGVGGDVITFVRRMENLDYMEAVKQLADRAGMALPEDGYDDTLAKKRTAVLAANRAAAKFFHSQLFTDRGRHALNYFLDRGLTMETIRHFGLGFAPDDWRALKNHLNEQGFDDILLESANLLRRSDKNGKVSYYDNFRNRVMFPIIDPRGNVIAFGGRVLDDSKPKYINTSDTLVYKKSNGVFALNFAKNGNDGKLIIAEGYMDVIALHQAGFTNAVACLGTALTKEQANLLSRYADEIILSYDADEAGQKATARALGIFGTTGMEIKVLRLTGGKDPDEIIKKYGAQRFRDIINGAANDTEYRLLRARQGIDLSTDDGKVKYLSAATEVLAGIPSPVEVDVYASRLANELGVDKLAIESQVKYKREGLRKRRMAQREQDQKRLLINGQNTKNPERSQHLRAAKAEETLIASLMRNPDFYNKLKDELSADYFVTALNRRIFSVILSRLDEGGNTEPYFLSSEFTPDEMDEVERIFRSAAQLSNTVEECVDCIKILKEEKNKPESIKASDLSDDDFAKLFRPDKRE
ncbi:MAG: DNA primase [Ruminococcaceae bacterium]|jgi:DNA primase|nr:DNA primase [Oscillospiraceae bacterium]